MPRCFVGGRPLFAPPPPVPKLRSPVLLGGRRAGSRLWSAVRERPRSPSALSSSSSSLPQAETGGENARLREEEEEEEESQQGCAPRRRPVAAPAARCGRGGTGGKGPWARSPPPGVCRSLPSCAALYLRVFIPVFFPDRVGGGYGVVCLQVGLSCLLGELLGGCWGLSPAPDAPLRVL